jgi:hypothetical protein
MTVERSGGVLASGMTYGAALYQLGLIAVDALAADGLFVMNTMQERRSSPTRVKAPIAYLPARFVVIMFTLHGKLEMVRIPHAQFEEKMVAWPN